MKHLSYIAVTLMALGFTLILSSCRQDQLDENLINRSIEQALERIGKNTQKGVIHSGQGRPNPTLGAIGDFYIDLTTAELYGAKTAEGWGKPISLKGERGERGDKGDKGERGDKGEQGRPGQAGKPGQDGKDGRDGQDGKPGANGQSGNRMYAGSGAPDSSLGQDGDWYIDKMNKRLYGPKTNGAWGMDYIDLAAPKQGGAEETPKANAFEGLKVDNGRKYLLAMNFTAQWCGFCPPIGNSMRLQEERYKPNYILVVLHSDSRSYDYYCHEANEIGKRLGVRAFPGVKSNNQREYIDAETECQKPDPIATGLSAKLVDSKLEVEFLAQARPDMTNPLEGKELNLLLWITEDGLVGRQNESGVYTSSYQHKNIFRGSINSSSPQYDGEPYTLGQRIRQTYSLPANIINRDNCNLVAILMDRQSRVFVDALRVPLKP